MERDIATRPWIRATRCRPPPGRRAKRLVDVVGAATAGIVLLPVIATTAIAVALLDGRPILFRQVRAGRGGKPFVMLKFRTMRAPRQGEVWYLRSQERVTRLGRILRGTSLDELPELVNVLRGDMSLVGPRPLLMEYMAEYTPEEQRRHDVRPGITGWAAIKGRHALPFRDRLALDVWYVDHWSLGLDFRIMVQTVLHVVRRTEASTAAALSLGFPLDRLSGSDPSPGGHGGSTSGDLGAPGASGGARRADPAGGGRALPRVRPDNDDIALEDHR